MKIVVTGASGFVGGHLCEHLIASGHQVSAVVRRLGSAPKGTAEVLVEDISGLTDWSGLLEGADAVIHLAARVHVMRESASDPLTEFRRVNVDGTRRLAEATIEQGVPRLVFLSSIKVNGEETRGVPFSALDDPHPVDAYGISKLEAERALGRLSGERALQVVVVRTPLVFGPGVGGNFARLLVFVNRGVPAPLGGIRNRRTMTSVWNLVDLLEKCAVEDGPVGATVLAGDDRSLSTPDLLRLMSREMNTKSRVFWAPVWLLEMVGVLTGRLSMVKRLTRSLEVVAGSSTTGWQWTPPISPEDGIGRTVGSSRERPVER